MKAEITNIFLSTVPPEIKITHGTDAVSFNVSYYGRNMFSNGFDIFEQINSYWESLALTKQNLIFECYKNLASIFDSFMSKQNMIDELNAWSIALLNHHDFESLRNWLFFSSNINIPNVFVENFVYDIDKQNSIEQTYLKKDYVDLVTMTIIFKTMMPIWGTYISHMRQEHGTLFKEYHAFKLIYGAAITHSVPYEKLITYIDKTIVQGSYNPTAIVNDISSEDFPLWILAKTIIRRLCVSDIRGLDPRANVVTFIYKYVKQTSITSDSQIDEIVKNKRYDDNNSELDGKFSAQERYRVKHEISLGEIVEIEYSISDLKSLAFKLTGNMTDELLNLCLATSASLNGKVILDPQMTLLRWVFKPVVSPRGLMYVDNSLIIKCLGVLQAVLWARGHHYLSILSTSSANINDGAMIISSVDSKSGIPKAIIEELDKVYPYQRMSGGKKTGYKSQNLCIRSVNSLVDKISTHSWISTADESMLVQHFNTNNKRIPVPHDIKAILAKLALELGTRSWV